MWIDEPEQLVRYLEVELDGEAGKRLIPLPLAKIRSDRVFVHSIFGKHFPDVPVTRSRNQVTLLEEEKICAYFAGGKLYASEARQIPSCKDAQQCRMTTFRPNRCRGCRNSHPRAS